MPAEWEPQSATWLSWPSNTALWPGHYDLIPAKFAEFAAAISKFQPVKINAAGKLRAEAERELKAAKHAGTERPRLSGKNIALIFEKDSTRTRAGFEVAAHDQGA